MATNNPARNSNKIVFIDTHVQNWQILWQEIQDQVDANQVEAILLDAGRDGLAQMAEAERRDIDAIHLLTHDSIITGTSGDDTLSGTSGADTIYGLDGQDTLNGLAGHDYLDGGTGADTMTGGLGDDTFVVDDPGDIVVEKSGEGTDTILSSISFNLAVSGAHIDNIVLTGSANIDATGNNLFNQLTGNSGDNKLDGGSDTDIMAGGDGDDTYIVDTSFDIVTEGVAAGNDTIQATFSYTLAANGNVENLDLSSAPSWASPTGTGNGLANHITGNGGGNTLNGLGGDDYLDGGAGLDILNGGTGNDSYVVDSYFDKVMENAGEGIDTVLSSVSGQLYILPAEVENLTLTGTGNSEGAGNGLDNVLIGNSGNNRLVGADGDDLLDGGAGIDVLAGGFGNDVYVVDNPGDQVLGENALRGGATDANGVPASLGANDSSDNAGVSADGNLVVFDSSASNLLGAGADTNNARDIFLKNMQTGAVTLISVGVGGVGADAYSQHAAITPDGRFVAFQSNAHNLVAGGDANPNYSDIYLRDTWNNTTTLVSSGVNGQANGYSELGSNYETAGRVLSDNGQFVVFTSAANNLVAGDTNGKLDIFVKDVVNGAIALASVSKTGVMGGQGAADATISADGRYVLFSSSSNSLVPGDANSATDIFRKDMQTGDVLIVSARQDGIQSAVGVGASDMSADGRFVVFNVKASEFGVTGNYEQAFLKDMVTGQLTLVSTAADGVTQANGYCRSATVSNDGRYVAFETNADNLAPGETNGSTDVYVKDVLSGAICRLSLGLDASQHNSESVNPLFSPDGKFLVFESGNTWNGGGIYRVANPFTNGSAGGIDEVRAGIDYTLANYIENLTLTGSGNIDGTGNTLDNVIAGNGGNNVIDGGLGADTASYATATVGVTVSLAVSGPQNTFGAGVDTLVNIERLKGSNFGDTLTAANGGSQLLGNDGDDILLSGSGDDLLDGGIGRDTASYANATGAVAVSLAISGAQVTGSAGIDTLVNIENLTGSAFGDQLTGNDGDNILDGGTGADTLTGGKGGDLYVVDNPGDDVVETGADNYTDTVVASIGYTLGDNLEALYLSGIANINGTGNGLHNTITGNAGDNVLDGGGGYDFLDGGIGTDTLKGGTGNDSFAVDNVGDVVVENFDEGVDTVNSLVDFSLAANIENLNLAGNANLKGFGNGLDNAMNGNIGNNQLDGGDGNDWLFGREGADTMNGGKGDDNYALDNVGDGVTEHTDEGIDTVLASITYTLAANVEKLVLTGAANIDGVGNTLANTLTGNAGNNKLDGGTDADALIGWAGDDSYGVDNSGDTVTEKVGEGYDTVQSSINYSLGGNVEALILAGVANLNGTGNTLANTLTGNAGNNKLDGGTDADVLIGGAGDDSYGVDNVGDTVTEKVGEGYDSVQSSISYSLGVNVEKLILTGAANLDGIGNTLANTLTGNAGNNKLTGGAGNDSLNGGAGADNLVGGVGNDSYMVDNAGDVVVEASGQGSDTVQSSISYILGANVENLSLIGKYSVNSIGNNGMGNALGNTLTGNQAKNALNGGAGNDTLNGGLGSDTLTGGAGNDIFRFDSSLGGKNIDKIQDFVSIHDRLYLDDAIFTNIGATGQFGSNDDRFWASAAGVAHDAADRIIYDSDSGALLYDADGNGAGLAIKFVTLTGHPSLVAEDIWVV